ncbi:hypothetical protein EIN_291380 [Entamoeba invadens IP1]|uniref:TLDc domain-containing protein n=1 Tax=Entamoeba invadens IP1 TaxID=370355 RepID=A0A0A1UFY5_ENTIV|nr:hypothetical protein EIN_291380 [Entamoeba invadens IP1]ELP92039.1 hypothetical protein EIN_291380 [Entamoeba invadens IP1]|eukprot:XP_004258810.1 hypothetical protein EIN_291380 [Entamoeba invadens IP1]
MVVEKEKLRCDKELATNTLRKAQIKNEFNIKASELTQKMKNSIFPNFKTTHILFEESPSETVDDEQNKLFEKLDQKCDSTQSVTQSVTQNATHVKIETLTPSKVNTFQSFKMSQMCNNLTLLKCSNDDERTPFKNGPKLFPEDSATEPEESNFRNLNDFNDDQNVKFEKSKIETNTNSNKNSKSCDDEKDENKKQQEKIEKVEDDNGEINLNNLNTVSGSENFVTNPFPTTKYEKHRKTRSYRKSRSDKSERVEINFETNKVDKVENLNTSKITEFLSAEDKAQLMEWSGRTVGKAVFNSLTDVSQRCSSRYSECMSNRNGFVLVISTKGFDTIFGCVVTKKAKVSGDYIHDDNCFIFSLKQNGQIINRHFLIKKEKQDFAFLAGAERSSKRFEIGEGDIKVWKNVDEKMMCRCIPNSFGCSEESTCVWGKKAGEAFEIYNFVVFELNK